MMALTNLNMKDVVPAPGDDVGSQRELGSDEILAPVRKVPLTVDAETFSCASCIAEAIKCGPHHQEN